MKKKIMIFSLYSILFALITILNYYIGYNILNKFISYCFIAIAFLVKFSILSYSFRYDEFKIIKSNINVNLFSSIYLLITIILSLINLNFSLIIIFNFVLFILVFSLILISKKRLNTNNKIYDFLIKDKLFDLIVNEDDDVLKKELYKLIYKYDKFIKNEELFKIDQNINDKITEYYTSTNKSYIIRELDLLLTVRISIIEKTK